MVMLYAALAVLVIAPLAWRANGAWRTRASSPAVPSAWDWRFSAASLLGYVLAFNLVFFVQEVFLVLPKALLPGVQATLFHNNHAWTGAHPTVELFQGTGALATLLLGLACALWLRRSRGGPTLRLLAFWLAFCGVNMALPQVVMGAIEPRGDVGRAMTWLQLSPAARNVAALLALLAIPAFALWLLGPLLALAPDAAHVSGARARGRFVLRTATLPALLGVALLVPFRMPREWIEVIMVPLVIGAAGVVWLQADAWRAAPPASVLGQVRWPLWWLLFAALALLAIFQLVLRPGITFAFA